MTQIKNIFPQNQEKLRLPFFRKLVQFYNLETHNIKTSKKSLISTSSNPNIIFKINTKGQFFKIISKIETPQKHPFVRLYYLISGKERFVKFHSIILGETTRLNISYINTGEPVDTFRFDPINKRGEFNIKEFRIIKISRLEYYLKTQKYKKAFKFLILILKKPILFKTLIHLNKKEIKKQMENFLEKQQFVTRMKRQISKNQKALVTVLDSYEKDYTYKLKTQKPIDIIIPIYNGFEFLDPLFTSLKENTKIKYRLIVINDNSPDKRIRPFLEKQKKKFNNMILIHNEENKGFVKNINMAVKLAKNHFVLLNSDTELPLGWLSRLMYPIINLPKVASTTPFSNSATIASFPIFLKNNRLPRNLNLNEIDRHFRKINPKKLFVDTPTGVGFCMGINFETVKKIGMFDEIFGLGYAEENDWCQRAIEAGYKNLLIPNLFVYHKHKGSFTSRKKKQLIEKNLQILSNKHPKYFSNLEKFINEDKWKILRIFLLMTMSKNIWLTFTNYMGGGANLYLEKLIQEKKHEFNIIKITFQKTSGVKSFKFNFISKDFDNENFEFILHDFNLIQKLLKYLGIKEIFINNLVSFPNIFQIFDFLTNHKAKIILPIHDYFLICPKFQLVNNDLEFCKVPNRKFCKACLKDSKEFLKKYDLPRNINIEKWRDMWSRLLIKADEIICFSNSSFELLTNAYPFIKKSRKIEIIPHRVDYIQKIYNKKSKQIKNIGIIGTITEEKGAKIVNELVERIEKQNLNLKVTLIGSIQNHDINSPKFYQTGAFDIKNLQDLVLKYDIDIFLIPSIWPETFSFTTHEVIHMGYPIIVFDLGAQAEAVKKYQKGYILTEPSADAIIDLIKRINQNITKK